MWWQRAGFGRFLVVNDLKEDNKAEEKSDLTLRVPNARFTKMVASGRSINTVLGTERTVKVDLLRMGLGRAGTKGELNLQWGLLIGPPVPDTWEIEYEISAPESEQATVAGVIPLKTPHGCRPMSRITFRYLVSEDKTDAWYAFDVDHYDWRDDTWSHEPVAVIGDAPAVRLPS